MSYITVLKKQRCLVHQHVDATMEPRYLKSDTWLMELPYTWSGGWRWQFMVMYSVFGVLMRRPRSAAASAVLESCDWALGMDDSSRVISLAKSRSFSWIPSWLARMCHCSRVCFISCTYINPSHWYSWWIPLSCLHYIYNGDTFGK